MDLMTMLMTYQPYDEQEQGDYEVMLRYLIDFPDIYERSNVYGHMTSSPWIMNETGTKVLMIYHNIYQSWGWCGGHCDGDDNVLEVALREGREETGLKNLKPVTEELFAIDILPVPRHYKKGKFISSHIHINTTFLCIGDDSETLHHKPDENSGVKWIPIEEIDEYVREEDMKPVYKKLVEKSKKYFK